MFDRFIDAKGTIEGRFISVIMSVVLIFSMTNVLAFAQAGSAEAQGATAEQASPDGSTHQDAPVLGGGQLAANEAAVIFNVENAYVMVDGQKLTGTDKIQLTVSGKEDLKFQAMADTGYKVAEDSIKAKNAAVAEVPITTTKDGVSTIEAEYVDSSLVVTIKAEADTDSQAASGETTAITSDTEIDAKGEGEGADAGTTPEATDPGKTDPGENAGENAGAAGEGGEGTTDPATEGENSGEGTGGGADGSNGEAAEGDAANAEDASDQKPTMSKDEFLSQVKDFFMGNGASTLALTGDNSLEQTRKGFWIFSYTVYQLTVNYLVAKDETTGDETRIDGTLTYEFDGFRNNETVAWFDDIANAAPVDSYEFKYATIRIGNEDKPVAGLKIKRERPRLPVGYSYSYLVTSNGTDWMEVNSNSINTSLKFHYSKYESDSLSYYSNDPNATGVTKRTVGKIGSEVTVAQNGFVNKDHVFMGWNTKPDGSGHSYDAGDPYLLSSDRDDVLYAQWQKIEENAEKSGINFYYYNTIDNSHSVTDDHGRNSVKFTVQVEENGKLKAPPAGSVIPKSFSFDVNEIEQITPETFSGISIPGYTLNSQAASGGNYNYCYFVWDGNAPTSENSIQVKGFANKQELSERYSNYDSYIGFTRADGNDNNDWSAGWNEKKYCAYNPTGTLRLIYTPVDKSNPPLTLYHSAGTQIKAASDSTAKSDTKWDVATKSYLFHPSDQRDTIGDLTGHSPKQEDGFTWRFTSKWSTAVDPETGNGLSDHGVSDDYFTSTWVNQDVNLYAVWEKVGAEDSLSYDGNGADGSMEATSGKVGQNVQVAENGFAKTGYVFGGWNTAANGSGKSYAAGSNYTLTPGVDTLYAQWLKPSVSLDNWTYGDAAATEASSVEGANDYAAPTYYYKLRDAADNDYTETKPSDAGTYTVKAVWAATSNCDEASATDDFTIAKRDVTLKSADLSKPYDGKPLTNADTALATETGWVDGQGATYSFSASQTAVGQTPNAFEYALKEGTSANNYNITKTEGTLKVNSADVSDTTAFRVDGLHDVIYSGTEQKLVPSVIDVKSGNALDPETDYDIAYSEDATNVGAVTVIVTGKGNYTGEQKVTYKILPAPVVIVVDDATKVAGMDDPAFTGTVLGLIAEGDLGEVIYSRIGTDEAVGVYEEALTATFAENVNYSVTVIPGDFTITDAPAPVTPPADVPTPPGTVPDGPLAPVITPVVDVLGGAAEAAIGDQPTPLADIDDQATPMAKHTSCWVHFYIILGIIVSAVYAVCVAVRRALFSHRLKEYEDNLAGGGDSPSGSPAHPGGDRLPKMNIPKGAPATAATSLGE